MSDNINNKISKGFRWSFILNFLSFFITFLGGVVLARLAGPELFGEYILLVAVIEMVSIVVAFSPGVILIQNREYAIEKLAGNALYFSLLLCALYLVMVLLIISIFYADSMLYMLVLCAAKITEIVSMVYVFTLDRLFLFKKKGVYLLIINVFSLVVAIGVALYDLSVWVFIVQYTLAKLIFAIVVWSLTRNHIEYSFEKKIFRLFFNVGKNLLFVSSLEKAKLHLDKIALGYVLTLTDVGLYTRGRNLAQMFQAQVFNAIRPVALSSFSELQNDNFRSSKLFNALLFLYICFSTSLFLVFVLFSDEIVLLLFGQAWIESADILKYMALLGVIAPILVLGRVFLYGRALYSIVNKIAFVELVSLILVYGAFFYTKSLLLLISLLTFVGVISLFLYYFSVNKIIDIRVGRLLISPFLALIVCYYTFSYVEATYFYDSFYLKIFALSPICITVYLASIYMFERAYIHKTIGYLKK